MTPKRFFKQIENDPEKPGLARAGQVTKLWIDLATCLSFNVESRRSDIAVGISGDAILDLNLMDHARTVEHVHTAVEFRELGVGAIAQINPAEIRGDGPFHPDLPMIDFPVYRREPNPDGSKGSGD